MIEYNKNFDDNSILPFFIQPQSDPAQGPVQFCHKVISLGKCKMKFHSHIIYNNMKLQKTQLLNFFQKPNAAESLLMTLNPYFLGGSSFSSNKPLMVFTGTDSEYSEEDYLTAVTAILILNLRLEPVKTSLQQNWIQRSAALIQTTREGGAQKCFLVLPIDIKSDWKRFTQKFSNMYDSMISMQ